MKLPDLRSVPADRPWTRPEAYWPALTAATLHLDPPLAVLCQEALAWNAAICSGAPAANRSEWQASQSVCAASSRS